MPGIDFNKLRSEIVMEEVLSRLKGTEEKRHRYSRTTGALAASLVKHSDCP